MAAIRALILTRWHALVLVDGILQNQLARAQVHPTKIYMYKVWRYLSFYITGQIKLGIKALLYDFWNIVMCEQN